MIQKSNQCTFVDYHHFLDIDAWKHFEWLYQFDLKMQNDLIIEQKYSDSLFTPQKKAQNAQK